ncbi:tyrosine-type recombinase/integrase [Rhodobacteraceae bacterium IMCC15231]|nr:tyrosine-type recombinase/integrase [Rhodobacteraceae bacterium IMCC15231]
MPEDFRTTKRVPIPPDRISKIQKDCFDCDDEARWLTAMISDTGMRLSEATGLLSSDIKLDYNIPHIQLVPHPWRRLKSPSSARQIPLIGASFWAAQRIKACGHQFAFPKYCSELKCNSNSASAALIKWLKPRTESRCVVHSFRHSLRDRLRAVECHSDIIDAIGGWTTEGVGQAYGTDHALQIKSKWMDKI